MPDRMAILVISQTLFLLALHPLSRVYPLFKAARLEQGAYPNSFDDAPRPLNGIAPSFIWSARLRWLRVKGSYPGFCNIQLTPKFLEHFWLEISSVILVAVQICTLNYRWKLVPQWKPPGSVVTLNFRQKHKHTYIQISYFSRCIFLN